MRTLVQRVRTVALICTALFSALFAKAQSLSSPNGKFEIGLGLGPMFFLGDLGGNIGKGTYFIKDVNLPITKFQKGLFINFYPQEWIGFRVAANIGKLEGADSLVTNRGGDEAYRLNRNLQFRTNITEAYAAIELYPTVFFEQYEGLQGKVRPYGLAGVGLFHFNPQAVYYSPNGTSRWVDLQPLRIEGQGLMPGRPNYKLTQMEIPVGAGVKWYVKENMYLGIEVLHRTTFTDYIDDVSEDYIDPVYYNQLPAESRAMALQLRDRKLTTLNPQVNGAPTFIGEQRGNPKKTDAFFSSILRFGWRLFDNSDADHMSCPKW